MQPDFNRLDAGRLSLIENHIRELEDLGIVSKHNGHQRLLRFLVDETLAGRGSALNAYAVGVDGLGKGENFDPAADSSLRVAMHTVRTALKNYYAGRPEAPVQIDLPRGSYRVNFSFAYAPAEKTQSPSPPSPRDDMASERAARRNWKLMGAGVIGIFLIVVIGAWAHQHYMMAAYCADARPIVKVAVNGGIGAARFKGAVEEYLAYYPITALNDNGAQPCADIPQYDLQLAAVSTNPSQEGESDDYTLRMVDRFNNKLLWARTYEAQQNPYYPPHKLIAAQVAYDVGHGTGIVANNALARPWGEEEAEKRFRCLVETHRYFSSGEAEALDGVLQCTGRYWQTSRMADLVVFYAALQYDVAGMAGVTKQEELTAMDDARRALDRAVSLSPNDKEVVVVKLKLARTATPVNVAVAADTVKQIDSYLPLEPHALNQAAITQSAFLGDFDGGYSYSRRASLITMNEPQVFTGELYYYVAREDWKSTEKFIYSVAGWEFPKEQILTLCISEKNGLVQFVEPSRAMLEKFGIETEADLLKGIDQQFPAPQMRTALRNCLNIIA